MKKLIALAVAAYVVLFAFTQSANASMVNVPTTSDPSHLQTPEGVLQISTTQFFVDCGIVAAPYLGSGKIRGCMDKVQELVDKGYGPLDSLTPVMDGNHISRIAGFMMNLRSAPQTEAIATVTIENGHATFGEYRQVVPRTPRSTTTNN